MENLPPLLPALALVPLLGAVIWSDLRFRRIPNRLVMTVAALALLDWALMPERSLGVGLLRLLLMLGALGLFCIPFWFGWMGGGDVKLLSALALWCTPELYLQLLLIASLTGFVVTLGTIFYLWHDKRDPAQQPGVPYGVAIAAAALWVLCQPVVNHLAA